MWSMMPVLQRGARLISVIMFGHFTEQYLSKKKVNVFFHAHDHVRRNVRRSARSIILRCSTLSCIWNRASVSSMIKQPIDHIARIRPSQS